MFRVLARLTACVWVTPRLSPQQQQTGIVGPYDAFCATKKAYTIRRMTVTINIINGRRVWFSDGRQRRSMRV
jgi:hypothetical protein